MELPYIQINGKETGDISVLDRGLQYGDGVFETIAVCDGAPLLWDQHWQRLHQGCAALAIQTPNQQVIESEIADICSGCGRAVLKLIVTRGNSHRGYRPVSDEAPNYIVYLLPWPDYVNDYRSNGATLTICETRLASNPRVAGIKHLNRLEQVLARAEWHDEYAEGLVLDYDNNVIEGTASNLFIVKNGALITPDLKFCGVSGVMRQQVMLQAHQSGIDVKIEQLSEIELAAADEIFVTNSIIGIWPVTCLRNKKYPVGVMTKMFQKNLGGMYCASE